MRRQKSEDFNRLIFELWNFVKIVNWPSEHYTDSYTSEQQNDVSGVGYIASGFLLYEWNVIYRSGGRDNEKC